MRRLWLAGLMAAAGCSLPHDADGTLDRVHEGIMRVGVAENAPWTVQRDSGVGGIEVELANGLAREIGARPEFTVGAEADLLRALKERKLDLVIGGFDADSPWAAHVAFTHPYEGGSAPKHVMALSPGENAWLVRVERYLQQHGARLAKGAP